MADFLEGDQVAKLVDAKVKAHGGPTKASQIWECSLQMVHLVRRAERKPTPAMLEDLGLELVADPEHARYRKVA